MLLRLDFLLLPILCMINMKSTSAYPFFVVNLVPQDQVEEGEWSLLDPPVVRRSYGIQKRAFDRLDDGDFGLLRKRAVNWGINTPFNRLDEGDFGMRKKRAFDRLESSDFFDFRRKRAFDRLDGADFGLEKRSLRSQDTAITPEREALLAKLASSLHTLRRLREESERQ